MTNASNTRSNQSGPTLHRSGHERIFAGVAGGLGEHLGINAWWFRWAFIFLALFAGIGVLVYLLAWIVIPGPDEDEPIVSGWVKGVDWSDGGAVFGVVLVGVAAILLATQVVHVSGVLVLAAVMLIVGLLLYRGDIRVHDGSGPSKPPPAGGATVDAHSAAVVPDAAPAEDADTPSSSPPDQIDPPPAPAARQKPPKPPRERSMLGRLTIAVGLIVVASMALVEVSDLAVDIEPFHYFAAIIAVVAVGLLVGAWAGRARWLIIIGVIVTPMLWIAMLIPTSWGFSIGEFHHTPVTVQDVQDVESSYEQGIGQMTIDLTALSPGELAEIGTISASLGLGEMIVRVPADVGVVVHASVGAGEVSGPFRSIDGLGIDITRDFGPEPKVLVLELEVAAGTINVAGPGAFLNDALINIEGSN